MSFGAQSFGGKRSKREVVDVPEPKPQDKSLDKLLNVRKQRIDRYERERREAREAWREKRKEVRAAKERWREAIRAYQEYWAQARESFFSMAITSGDFRKAKAVYERMKAEAIDLRIGCQDFVKIAKAAGKGYFEAKQRALQANKQQEKLGVLRDEIRAQNKQPEM